MNIIPVTASVVWQDTGTMDDNIDIVREFSYRIEAGSARRPDQELRVEQAQMIMEMVGQMSLQLPPEVDVETYNKTLDVLYDAFMIAHPQRVYLTPQPELPPVIPGQGMVGGDENPELSQANIPQGPPNSQEMGFPMANLPTSGAGML